MEWINFIKVDSHKLSKIEESDPNAFKIFCLVYMRKKYSTGNSTRCCEIKKARKFVHAGGMLSVHDGCKAVEAARKVLSKLSLWNVVSYCMKILPLNLKRIVYISYVRP